MFVLLYIYCVNGNNISIQLLNESFYIKDGSIYQAEIILGNILQNYILKTHKGAHYVSS